MIFLSELATILKVTGSKSPKGSSSIKISGLDIRTDAIATLTCCPPDITEEKLNKIDKYYDLLIEGNNKSRISGPKFNFSNLTIASFLERSVNW